MGWNSSSAASAPPPHLILGGGLFPTGILHYKQPLVSLRFRYSFLHGLWNSLNDCGWLLLDALLSVNEILIVSSLDAASGRGLNDRGRLLLGGPFLVISSLDAASGCGF